MNRKSFLVILSVVMLTGGLILTGCGRHPWGTPEKRADYAVKKITSELDLTKEQQSVLNKIKGEVLAKLKEDKTGREDQFLRAVQLVKSDKLDTAAVEKIFNEREARMKALRPFMIEKIAEFHAVLTKEQKNKFAKLLEEKYRKFSEN